MLTQAALKFDSMPWVEVSDLARQKSVQLADRAIRILELKAGFAEPDWCQRGHVGFVIAGKLRIDIDGQEEVFSAGDGLLIPEGKKHRALPHDENVTLFLVDEL